MYVIMGWFAYVSKFRILFNIYHDFFCLFTFYWKKRVWLVNGFFVGPIGDLVSRLKKQQRKYSYFKIQNFFKLENHWMIWYAYQWHKCIINPKFKCYPLIADFNNNYKNNIMLALTLIGISYERNKNAHLYCHLGTFFTRQNEPVRVSN